MFVDEIYVINLDREITRLKDFDSTMAPWSYTRMPAINGKNINTTYRLTEDNLSNCKSTLDIDPIIETDYIKTNNWLSPGERGCLLSHVALWKLLLDSPEMNRIMIFEDDARSHLKPKHVQKKIEELYNHLHDSNVDEPDILYLGKALDSCHKYERVYNHVYRSYHSLCLHAYIINKDGARKLLRSLPYSDPIDVVPIKAVNAKQIVAMTFHPSLYFQDILNNTSSLRPTGQTLNLTCECLVEQQHISGDGLQYLGIVIFAFIVILILYIIYVFAWIK